MTISVDWGNTNIITVELADLTLVSGTFYTFDTNAFRLTLKDLEDDTDGISFPTTHNHNTEVTVAGTTYARTLEILSPYSVEFPDSQITVQLTGSNNNIFDVQNGILVQNQCQVVPTNSAGLIVTTVGSGLSASQATQLLEIYKRLDLDSGDPNTYQDDNSQISNGTFDLDKTDNMDGTFTVNRT